MIGTIMDVGGFCGALVVYPRKGSILAFVSYTGLGLVLDLDNFTLAYSGAETSYLAGMPMRNCRTPTGTAARARRDGTRGGLRAPGSLRVTVDLSTNVTVALGQWTWRRYPAGARGTSWRG